MTRQLDGKAAYFSQTPFITNETLRANILFGQAMEEERYEKTLAACETSGTRTHTATALQTAAVPIVCAALRSARARLKFRMVLTDWVRIP